MNKSLYPVWWDSTITIYNRHQDLLTDVITWHRTVVKGCFVKNANNKVTINNTTIESNNVLARIRQSRYYKPYGTWYLLPNDTRTQYFTLHQGDIIAYGKVDDEVDEYTRGQRSTDLISKLKASTGCFVVENYQENIGSGRVDPHYYVTGV